MTGAERKRISVLIAEDSPTQREALLAILEEAGEFEVVGTVRDGQEALNSTGRLRPDIVLMDCHMPKANGFEATRMIMQQCPTPIVMVSSTLSQGEIEQTFEAIKSGALAFLVKPGLGESPEDAKSREALKQTLRLMSEVRVVGRRSRPKKERASVPALPPSERPKRIIAIAGSTGAPGVIADILSAVSPAPAVPVLIVQHMASGFVPGFARWLSSTVGFPVKVAEHGMSPIAGQAYLAPDGHHMGLDRRGRIALSDAPPEEGFRPSANFLFRSVAQSGGASTLGVLLTGMGRDGAAGLLEMRRAGATTIAQDEASCVVFGMPREAIALGAAEYVLPPSDIGRALASTTKDRNLEGSRSVKK
jgi:two-component system chemotaxis response regulator CheB